MKNLILAFSLLAFVGSYTTSYAFDNTATVIDCDHCKKGHKSDDTCKDSKKGKCCKDGGKASASKKSKCSSAEAKACCKKKGSASASKGCHGKAKADATVEKTPEL